MMSASGSIAGSVSVNFNSRRVDIDAGGQIVSQMLRVVRVAPAETTVLVPTKR